jgi:hypothetical protein
MWSVQQCNSSSAIRTVVPLISDGSSICVFFVLQNTDETFEKHPLGQSVLAYKDDARFFV